MIAPGRQRPGQNPAYRPTRPPISIWLGITSIDTSPLRTESARTTEATAVRAVEEIPGAPNAPGRVLGYRDHLLHDDHRCCVGGGLDGTWWPGSRPLLEASRLPVSNTGRRRWRGYRGNAGDSSPRDWLALDHRECLGRLVALGRCRCVARSWERRSRRRGEYVGAACVGLRPERVERGA
jgi:hypothetical protein